MELVEFVRSLRRRWLVIVAILAIALAGAVAMTVAATPVYRASAQLFVAVSQSGETAADLNAANTFTQQRVKSYAQTVRTASVLGPVISDLGLDVTPRVLASSVSATAVANTAILEIAVTDESPELAAEIANAISAELPSVVSAIEPPDLDGNSPVMISTVQPATVPNLPTDPSWRLNVLLGLAGGLVVGLGVVLILEATDTRVRKTSFVRSLTAAPILGRIPADPSAVTAPLLGSDGISRARSEAYRTLRAVLLPEGVVTPFTRVVVTSAGAGEGRTLTAANIALSLTEIGVSTAFVEADLRHPRSADYFGESESVGVAQILAGDAELPEALETWHETSLAMLPAGGAPENPNELLSTARLTGVVDELSERFEAVVYDAPSALEFSDAGVLARAVGGVLVVVAMGITRKRDLVDTFGALDSLGATVRGVVLTRYPVRGVALETARS